MRRRALGASCLFVVASALWGCTPSRLDQLSVPEGFAFANSREVRVRLDAAAASLGASGWGRFEIARSDGKVLYRGALGTGRPAELRLPVPSKDQSLQATLRTEAGAEQVATLAIVGDATSHSF